MQFVSSRGHKLVRSAAAANTSGSRIAVRVRDVDAMTGTSVEKEEGIEGNGGLPVEREARRVLLIGKPCFEAPIGPAMNNRQLAPAG